MGCSGGKARQTGVAWPLDGGLYRLTGSRLVCRMERGFVFGGHAANPLAFFPKCDSILHTPTTRHYMSLNSMCVCVVQKKSETDGRGFASLARTASTATPSGRPGVRFQRIDGKRV